MKVLLAPLRWIWAWLDRAVCAGLALLLAQAPVYTDQYLDRLAEVRARTAEVYDQTLSQARSANLNLETYLRRSRDQRPNRSDSLDVVESTLRHHQYYVQTHQALLERRPWWRPIYLLSHADNNLRASMDFQPDLPLSQVGLAYAALGLTLGGLLMAALKWLGGRLIRRKSGKE